MVPTPVKTCRRRVYGVTAPAAVDLIHCLHERIVPPVRWAEKIHLLIAFRSEAGKEYPGFLIKVPGTVDGPEQPVGGPDQQRCMGSRGRESECPAGAVLRLLFFKAVGAEKDMDNTGEKFGVAQLESSLCGIGGNGFLQGRQGFDRGPEGPGGGNGLPGRRRLLQGDTGNGT